MPSLKMFGVESPSQPQLILALSGIFGAYVLSILHFYLRGSNAPLVGRRFFFEPEWLVGVRFIHNSAQMIQYGYDKYKNTVFKVRRNDGIIFVIPNSNLERLRNMPEEKINGLEAHIKNLFGPYSTTEMMLESDLPTRVIQQKLTPNLLAAVPKMKDELEYALEVEVPNCQDEWVSVQVFDLLCRIIARVSARVFLGLVICRNERWFEICMRYTENVHLLVMTMRMVPSYMHWFIAPLIPAFWRVRSILKEGKRFISPLVQERRAAEAENRQGYKQDNDLLQWMMDLGYPNEALPDKLAHRQLLMSLATTHTTGMAAAHVMYDLCAYPGYLEQIREELLSVLRSHGGWHKSIIPKMRKLDSFMKESQRLNPPALIAFNRIARVPLELSDGTKLPPGTHFCMASNAISRDVAHLPGGGSPDAFDPFRWQRLRDDPSDPENVHRYQFSTTDSTSLHFGHGKFACPGRFFASQLIKMILGHILLRYDLKYPEGQGRPRNLVFDENIYPDPKARMLMRRRKLSIDEPFC
ncbi:cytochrome P450 [Daldinia caldariorum]|uniref:cytochrome P450 n=1 Tax=Daldinia caldariorum TaxID=326644 RepID=UPI0020075CF8|nr:cytochrome P450 [Daldinia caldariorum]KAI1470986.1 cytochrome P450 [Daldinia caldariorum]